MGAPSGTFSSQFAGKLRVVLSATFYANSYLNTGFPNTGNGGGSNLSLRAYAGPSGSLSYSSVIDKYNCAAAVLELDYPGGNVSWLVGAEEVAHQNPSGPYSYGMSNIKVSVKLSKR